MGHKSFTWRQSLCWVSSQDTKNWLHERSLSLWQTPTQWTCPTTDIRNIGGCIQLRQCRGDRYDFLCLRAVWETDCDRCRLAVVSPSLLSAPLSHPKDRLAKGLFDRRPGRSPSGQGWWTSLNRMQRLPFLRFSFLFLPTGVSHRPPTCPITRGTALSPATHSPLREAAAKRTGAQLNRTYNGQCGPLFPECGGRQRGVMG